MGGNKTLIIDEELLYNQEQDDWVVEYHKELQEKKVIPVLKGADFRLRRLTIKEAALIQTFSEEYIFKGSKSSIYRQIGNAEPCFLAEAVASVAVEELENIQHKVIMPMRPPLETHLEAPVDSLRMAKEIIVCSASEVPNVIYMCKEIVRDLTYFIIIK